MQKLVEISILVKGQCIRQKKGFLAIVMHGLMKLKILHRFSKFVAEAFQMQKQPSINSPKKSIRSSPGITDYGHTKAKSLQPEFKSQSQMNICEMDINA